MPGAPQPRRPLDWIYLVYFVSHIPITVLVDVVPLFPKHLVPGLLLDINHFLTAVLGDPFMVAGPTRSDMAWFRSMLLCELLFQLPFFFYAVAAVWRRSTFRHLPLVVYGAHVSTTMVPILGTLAVGDIDRSSSQRLFLASMYIPYLLIPLTMAVDSFISCARVFASSASKLKSN
ncbi:hypothetical protein GGI07_004966 [Coemansia sp. Benny D115]|nr:hypothetical protein GGI07_004966 [Coemansia sp. Benny D115]